MICYCHTNLYDIVIVGESIDKKSLCRHTSRVIVLLDDCGVNVAGQIHLHMGFHENPNQTPAQRPMIGLSKPTLYKSYCPGLLHTSPTSSLCRKNRVLTIGAVCGKACTLAPVAVKSTL